MEGQLNQNPFNPNQIANTNVRVSEYPSTNQNFRNNIIPFHDNAQQYAKEANLNFLNSYKMKNPLDQNDPLAQTALLGPAIYDNKGQTNIEVNNIQTEIKSNNFLPEFGGTNFGQNQNLNQFFTNGNSFNVSEFSSKNIQNQIMPSIPSSKIVLPLSESITNNIQSASPITNINDNLQNNINLGKLEVIPTMQREITNIDQIPPMNQDNQRQNNILFKTFEISNIQNSGIEENPTSNNFIQSNPVINNPTPITHSPITINNIQSGVQTQNIGFSQPISIPNTSSPIFQPQFATITNNSTFETQNGNMPTFKILPTITLNNTNEAQNKNTYLGQQISFPNATLPTSDMNNTSISPNIFELKNQLQNIDLSSSYIMPATENNSNNTNVPPYPVPSNLGTNTSFPISNTYVNNIPSNMTPLEYNNLAAFTAKPISTINSLLPTIETKQVLPAIDSSQNITLAMAPISTNTFPLGTQNQNDILSTSYSMLNPSPDLKQMPFTTFSQNQFIAQPNQTLNTLPLNESQNISIPNMLPTQTQNPLITHKINPPIYIGENPTQTISPKIFTLESQNPNTIISPTINTSLNWAQNQITTLPSTVIPLELKNYNISSSPALNTSLSLAENPNNIFPEIQTKNYNISSYSALNTSYNYTKPQITTFPSTIIPLENSSSPLPTYNISSYNQNQNEILSQSYSMPNITLPSTRNQITAYTAPHSNIDLFKSIDIKTDNSIYKPDPLQTSMNYSQNYSTNSINIEDKIPKNLRTETEIVPVEEIEYIPVKKIKYVKRTKVFVPKIRKVYIPVKKKIIVPVKKKIYIPVNSSSSIQYNTGSFDMNNSQIYNSMSHYNINTNANNMPIPYSSDSIKSNNSEIDYEVEKAVPIKNYENPPIQVSTSINPPIPINTSTHNSNYLNTSLKSGIGSPLRKSYIHTGQIYKPRTYRARSLSNRKYF